jgi:hypothetical protein
MFSEFGELSVHIDHVIQDIDQGCHIEASFRRYIVQGS